MGIFSEYLNRAKVDDKLMLVFDIGSSHVGGALFFVGETGVPKIIKIVREPITLQKNLAVDKFFSSTIKSLDAVVSKIHKGGHGAPGAIFCVLSSPWHVSQTRVVKLEKNTPFVFTTKLADSLIQKEIALFEEEYLAKYQDTLSPVESIEFKNIKTMLNGYESPNPLNQKAHELEMTIFFSISPKQVLKKIEQTVAKYFFFKKIKFSSFTLSSFAVVRDAFTDDDDFLLMDIDGEVTDISMAKKNLLRESISFPLGCNFIARRAATLLRSSVGEAESMISLYRDGHATELTTQKMSEVMEDLRVAWLVKFQESLANLSNDISIPSNIYLSVDKDEADFFLKTIINEQFNQYTLTQSKFKVNFLNPESFQSMVAYEGNVSREPRLIIDSIYINRFLIKK